MDVTVAIDCMGGDHGPQVTVPAALEQLERDSRCSVVLVGLQEPIMAELAHCRAQPGARLRIQHASEVVGMDEQPAAALRSKKDCSIRVAVDLLKVGQADAVVSAGNTGAAMTAFLASITSAISPRRRHAAR